MTARLQLLQSLSLPPPPPPPAALPGTYSINFNIPSGTRKEVTPESLSNRGVYCLCISHLPRFALP